MNRKIRIYATGIMLMMIVPCLSAQVMSVVPELFRYDSIVSFNASNNRIGKEIYNYSQQGLPILMENYAYTNGLPELNRQSYILNDNGNEITTNDSVFTNGSWMNVQIVYKLDNHGNLIEQTMKTEQGSAFVSYIIHYGINNRIDSFYIDIPSYGTVEKYIYTYNANDLPTTLEKHNILDNSRTVAEYSYIYGANNKLEGRLLGIFTYTNGILDTAQNRKEVQFYDALERPLRKEIFTWDTLKNDYKEEYDSYTIRFYKTKTAIPHYTQSDISVTVSINNGLLTIDSPVSETIEIYSIIGSQQYKYKKIQGQTTVALPSFSQGIYIVRGSSGWTKKTIKL